MTTNNDTYRPSNLDEYIGQDKLKARMKVRLDAALAAARPPEHMLFCSGPGVGKSALAKLVAEYSDEKFVSLAMPYTESKLIDYIENFHGVLLLEETHRCSVKQQEALLPLLEFGTFTTSKGWDVKSCWLTIIGATTERQKIIKPLYDRFTIRPEWEAYSGEEMQRIVIGMAAKAGVELPDETTAILGKAAAGTPRLARQFVLAARDLIVTHQTPTPEKILDLCGSSIDGLSETHLGYLSALKALGGQAGVRVLGTMLRLNEEVCVDLERLLIEQRLIKYTPAGRNITNAGIRRITVEPS